MFISSLTITAVFLACVCFCIARVSATSTTTSTTPSGAETPMLQRGGNHHYHYHDHQQTEESKDGVSGSAGGGHSIKIHNFISTDALYDGEQERRVHYNGVTAKETAVTTVAAANNTRESVKLRQVTDGSHFIQLIYGADNEIRDCEFLRQKKIVQDFLETFRKDIERAKVSINRENDYSEIENETEEDIYSFNNVTFQILDNGVPLPTDLSEWLDFEDLKQRCRENHREMKRLLRHKQHGTSEQKRHANNHLERWRRCSSETSECFRTTWNYNRKCTTLHEMISDVFENGRHGSSQSDREAFLQHCSDKMFCAKTTEIMCEEIMVGKVLEAEVQKTSPSQRQHSLLRRGTCTACISPHQISLTKVKFSP